MAIYRCSMQVFSRAKGQTSTAAAAYRAASRIEDQRTGVAHDYTRRGGVESVEMVLPDDAPGWARDPASFWNAAEAVERKNGRPAREWLVALPHELSQTQHQELVRALARELVDRYGVGVMAAVHEPSAKGDDRNVHVHLLFSTRCVGPDGFTKKVRVLDDRVAGPQEVERLRARTAEFINRHLVAAGISERVDHRRLAVQAREAEERGDYAKAFLLTRATQRTEGRASTAAKRRGEPTSLGRWNARVRRDNNEILRYYVARVEHAAHHRSGPAQRRLPMPPLRRAPRRPTMPSSIIAAMERTLGAFGPGGHTINQQAKSLREQRRTNEAAERRFVRMLEEEMARINRNNRTAIAVYAAALRLQRPDIRALAAHCEQDPECARLVRKSVELRRRIIEIRAVTDRRRDEYGAAMVRSTEARNMLESVEANKPSALRPMRRRDWAELRRRQRADLAGALVAEHAARAAASRSAGAKSFQDYDELSAELAELERTRCRQFPLPMDVMGDSCAPKMARRVRQKIGNKIGMDSEVVDPRERPRLRLAPRLGSRHRPIT
jgi:hypothetical protein